ncbi:sulfotransferase family protein [Altererythrobacter sp. B11]|uniref:sulfotransferase family protein n=1 Tax=Altererythrobacter sp. B11 TaxID=2060312 RepID=UPI000DC71489|nr:sulfotransferase [Altererythrobacter sp. B11]BBC70961.1 sulfotransferase family protein [Altererythrobacter sp. B11]
MTPDKRFHEMRFMRPSFFLRRLARKSTFNTELTRGAQLSEEQRAHLAETSLSAQRQFEDKQLLFVFGLMPRSGTNFLYEMMLHISQVERPGIAFDELPILAWPQAFDGPLELINHYHPPSAQAFDRLSWLAFAAAGLRNRLLDMAPEGSMTLIKEPHFYGIDLFPLVFPQDRAVLVVRDGRYIVDSFRRSFTKNPWSRSFEDLCVEFREAAQAVERFRSGPYGDRMMIARYEDVNADRRGYAEKILAWLGREPRAGDLDGLDDMPIYGSSVRSVGQGGGVDWTPVKDKAYNPATRAIEWTSAQRKMFEAICGEANRRLGYD